MNMLVIEVTYLWKSKDWCSNINVQDSQIDYNGRRKGLKTNWYDNTIYRTGREKLPVNSFTNSRMEDKNSNGKETKPPLRI